MRIDHVTYRRALLAGDLGPGTYHVFNVYMPSERRPEVITLPSRLPDWMRGEQGRLWHRIRYVQILWSQPGVRNRVPRAVAQGWCGVTFNEPRFAAPHTSRPPLCTWCETNAPDRRRMPDALRALRPVPSAALTGKDET